MESNTSNTVSSKSDTLNSFPMEIEKSPVKVDPKFSEKTFKRVKIRSSELFQVDGIHPRNALAGVCIDGIHYYDFKNIQFISNTGMASLIDLLKCMLEKGERVLFVNVNEEIKGKIRSLGLDGILKCS